MCARTRVEGPQADSSGRCVASGGVDRDTDQENPGDVQPPAMDDGGAKYDMANLVSACKPCHARETRGEVLQRGRAA
jgi:hypothetical protein